MTLKESTKENFTGFSSKSLSIWEGDVELPFQTESRLGAEDEDNYDPYDAYDRDKLHGKYWRTLQALKPIRLTKRKVPASIDNCNLFQFMLFTWLTPTILKARKGLEIDDIPLLSKFATAKSSSKRLQRIYEDDGKNSKDGEPRIGRAVMRFIRTRLIVCTCVMITALTAAFCGPAFLVSRLTGFATLQNPTISYGVGLTLGLMCTEFTRSLSFAMFWGLSVRSAIRARSAVLSIVFKKIGRLRSLKDKSVGEVVNLLSNDGTRLAEMIMFLGIAIASPVMLLITTIFSCLFLGWTAIIGVSVFVIFIPLQMFIGTFMAGYRRSSVKVTDKRVRIMNEILNSVKLIKMYAWEGSFAKSTADIRSNEEALLRKSGNIQSLQIAIITIVPVVACSLTFITHTSLGYPLDATMAFTIIGVFNSMRVILAILPQAVKAIAEVNVSFQRIDSILEMEELSEYISRPEDNTVAVALKDLTSAWDVVMKDKVDSNKSDDLNSSVEVLFDINYIVPKGRLVGICGAVGSGKSSFISTILGHLRITKGAIEMQGSVAYVAQQAWIFHGTVRENILFGQAYDENKFNKVAYACSLKPDFEILPDGELTEVGARGLNLSGGQKQRISLARAVYSGHEIVLLDDPLSAVDAHVGKHIFFECIRGMLKGRTVIFVTHQLQYLKDCDEIIVIKNGRFEEQGTHDDLINNGNDYSNMITNFYLEQKSKDDPAEAIDTSILEEIKRKKSVSKKAESDTDESDESDYESVDLTTKGKENNIMNGINKSFEMEAPGEKKKTILITDETKSSGGINASTYKAYFKAAGGYIVVVIGFLVYLALLFGVNMNTWWLSIWINAGGAVESCDGQTTTETSITDSTVTTLACEEIRGSNITENEDLTYYQLIYVGIMLGTLVVGVIKAYTFTYVTLRASTSLHNQVFKAVFRSPMYFFDTTPSGRILNRFARDMDDIDVKLVIILDLFIQQMLLIVFALITMVIVFPWFLIGIAILVVVFGYIYTIFKAGVRELKKLDNTTRSPWFSHITSSISGLSTIHAYQKTEDMVKKHDQLLDINSQTYFGYLNATRWLSVRLDALTVCVTVVVSLFVVFSTLYPDVLGATSASFAGLALTYAIQLTGLFQVCVRFSIETESLFTAVERINEYIVNCPYEEDPKKKLDKASDSWPNKGAIKFKKACMRYRDGLPSVLKDVSINIKAKEKIGVVGRTGSGKSSLGVVLFRLCNVHAGKIKIDGIDTGKISLNDLRSRLSIIPQEPVLFVGTVRYNLDPFNKYDDNQIWGALELSHMKSSIAALPDKLETQVVENGENFSVGERQLMCMTRAILRNSRIIMLDEATAAIDSETDSLVQETIRKAFADCTMLTIAHRLNTVLTSDKILVMDDGKVAEFGEPAVLLSDPESHFSKMIEASASNQDTEVPIKEAPQVDLPKIKVNDSENMEFTNAAFVSDEESSEDDFTAF